MEDRVRMVQKVEDLKPLPLQPSMQLGDETKIQLAPPGPPAAHRDPAVGDPLSNRPRLPECGDRHIKTHAIEPRDDRSDGADALTQRIEFVWVSAGVFGAAGVRPLGTRRMIRPEVRGGRS